MTTLPAPITHPFPIVTPGHTTTFAPSQQSFPIVTGSALPAMAMAAPGTGGAGGRGATPIAAGLPPITFVINAAPGQSEEAIAEMVARKLRELGIAAPGAGSPSFGDRPDWE